MVAPTLVKITLYNPGQDGDTGSPFVGRALFKPSIERHIEGETPPDYVVTTQQFGVTFGTALMDGDTIVQPGTPGVAWVLLEPTDYGPYADLWFWSISFTSTNTACVVESGDYFVPTTGAVVDFGDLVQVAPPSPTPPPDWVVQLANEVAARINGDDQLQTNIDSLATDLADEVAARIAADADLQTQINAIDAAERAVSTDGSYGLPAPTGNGLEFVWTAGVLDDIRYDGNPG
jgi:hypothetical protein